MNTTNIASADPIDVIHRAQQSLAKFLLPNSGIHPTACISELLGILDSRGAAALTAHIQRRDERFMQREMVRLFLDFLQNNQVVQAAQSGEDPAAQSGEDPQAIITRLRSELASVRKHELHLIQHRDELIPRLCAAEQRLQAISAALA